MTHPYRLALSSATSPTCLDPPLRACDPPPTKKRPRIEILLAGCAVIAGTVGVVTLHAVGHGGHVEIAPAALAHARSHVRPKREATPAPTHTRTERPPAVAKMPFLSGAHEPKELLSHARELQSLGLDVSIVDVQMAKPFTEWPDTQLDFWPTSSVPVYGPARHLDALELHGVPLGSTLRVAGIAEGDQLLGIDGYTLAGDTLQTKLDPNVIRKRGSMVVEIARGDHHVVLSIHWPLR